MFTGIIENIATVSRLDKVGSNIDIWLQSEITNELKIDQSVSHNGVCLTVIDIAGDIYKVTAIDETLKKTNLFSWRVGARVNLERSLQVGARLDGHFVQGHIDTTARCIAKNEQGGSWLFQFEFPEAFAPLVIEKGSACINGVSLTVFDVGRSRFSVAIIPYTYHHTNFGVLEVEGLVNIEFDVLGKYLLRSLQLQENNK